MISDLRTFIQALEEQGELVRFSKPVNPVGELGAILATLERRQMGAGFFSCVEGHSHAVVGGLLSNHKKIAIALDTSVSKITEKIDSVLSSSSLISPVIRTHQSQCPPCQQVVHTQDAADFSHLPIPVHAPGDGGPFITAGVTISRSIHGGRQNLSYQRMHIKERQKSGMMINQWRHARNFLDEAEKEHTRLPVAIAVGVDPVIMIAAGIKTEEDEMAIASTLRGKAIELVPCITNDILVPSHAECIIEGYIDTCAYEEEGPLAEFTGHYGHPWKSPVFRLKAITHRSDYIWQTLNGASYEHINLGNVLPREPKLKQLTSYVSPRVTAVHIPPYGSGFLALVSMDKSNEGEPKNVALAAMTSHINIKSVIVVDSDVDIFNPADVLWALSTRFNPITDLFVIPHAQGHELDPSALNDTGLLTKMGIDATFWSDKIPQQKVVYPPIDIQEFV